MKFVLPIIFLFSCEAIRFADDGETVSSQKGPAITQVSKTIFRIAKSEQAVWDSTVNVLMKNYNLNVVDRSSGVVSTEWDSFFSNNLTLRNKVSVRVRKISSRTTEVSIHNSTEKLADASTVGAGGGAVWLPADDSGAEVKRIIHNTALALNLTPPIHRIEEIARGQGTEPELKSDPGTESKTDSKTETLDSVEESELNQL